MIIYRIICLVIGYIFGLFPSGKFVGKLKQVDLTKEGSGNIGATNALRVTGVSGGVLTLLGDVLKAVIPMMIALALFHRVGNGSRTLMLYAGIGAVLGHDFPFNRGFKGGKGVASLLGMVLTFCPKMVPVLLIIFLALAIGTGYVSLASMTAAAGMAVESYIFAVTGRFRDTGSFLVETCVLFTVIAALTIFQHRENIRRLRAGTENRFGHKKE
ncbi:MAG: glycerol-3-phosphate acyltransferase [Lachnospiraceae bacterium]|nr:glycerol-3-phosphate acyltransferase [Lachnospiraceae bacterium]